MKSLRDLLELSPAAMRSAATILHDPTVHIEDCLVVARVLSELADELDILQTSERMAGGDLEIARAEWKRIWLSAFAGFHPDTGRALLYADTLLQREVEST